MGTLGLNALNPFSKPVPPLDPLYSAAQIRGAINQVAKSITQHDADATLHLVTTTTSNVGVLATTIYPTPSGQVAALVAGTAGTASFLDQVAWHPNGTAVVVWHSSNTRNAPAARTYSIGGSGELQIAMAVGTYTIQVIPMGLF